MPRRTDSRNPADWLWLSASDLELLALAGEREVGYVAARSKLAEVLEKVIKAELIRIGWALVKTHDLIVLSKELRARQSDLLEKVQPLAEKLAEHFMLNRYPGFDFADVDWPAFRADFAEVAALHAAVQARVTAA